MLFVVHGPLSVAVSYSTTSDGQRTTDNTGMCNSIVEIKHRSTGSSARILPSLGFNCFSWKPVLGDRPCEMLWADSGFEAGDRRPSGSGIPLLFPFPGRIGGATYTFDGSDFQLEPG